MKARLVLEPAVLQGADPLAPTRPWSSSTRSTRCRGSRSILAADGDADELRALADVEGVAEIRFEPIDPGRWLSRPEPDRASPSAAARGRAPSRPIDRRLAPRTVEPELDRVTQSSRRRQPTAGRRPPTATAGAAGGAAPAKARARPERRRSPRRSGSTATGSTT